MNTQSTQNTKYTVANSLLCAFCCRCTGMIKKSHGAARRRQQWQHDVGNNTGCRSALLVLPLQKTKNFLIN